ncbi:hypothetical protein METUNv1_01622 [Methyloversatilis universalis FAM5]|uniref:Uncharacterized protein n=1 Tax=Methyloversatilis universalis (strain ATCC BAA-1314 / DSM 25237 / JCM 13912 / CCUG 52030 / FAM5) TaxID=1000565 RepID=F5RBH9_METUF|nr:hypothetical protein METUNv1_01622 [Methyloversatilis universalis FAM5]
MPPYRRRLPDQSLEALRDRSFGFTPDLLREGERVETGLPIKGIGHRGVLASSRHLHCPLSRFPKEIA